MYIPSRSVFLMFLLLSVTTLAAHAQQENKWAFGMNAGLDFTTGNPVAFQTAMSGFGEGEASVCDANGQLLFYTEGSFIWDRNNNLMPGGSDLTGLTSATTYSVTSSASQGTLIIPMPGNTNRYYVFSLTSMEQNALGNAGRLYYSVVDMTLNGGMGDVVPGQKGVFIDSALSERMTAVVGDRCNIWVITCSADAHIKAYEVNFSVVNPTPVVSAVGMDQIFTGNLAASPDGHKLAATKCNVFGQGFGGAMLFDFDIVTGLASNPVSLLPAYGGYSVCFSPDNSKLYVVGGFQHLFQYNLNAGNAAAIQASETLIGPAGMTDLKMAPDGKMYFKANEYLAGSPNFLAALNAPNMTGAAALYVANAVMLAPGTAAQGSLPNIVPSFSFSKDTIHSTQYRSDVCFNNSILLEATNTAGWGYTWSDGAGGTLHAVNAAGTYTVGYFTSPCSYNIDTFETFFSSVYTTNSCYNQANGMAWVTPAYGDSTLYTYVWTDTAGTVLSTDDTLTGVAHGYYRLQVTAAGGCNTKIDVAIAADVYETSFTADTLACVDKEVSFVNTSDPYFTGFNWFFGNGITSVATSPSHSFSQPGEYQVMLVGNGGRCSDTSYRSIHIDSVVAIQLQKDKDSICMGATVLLEAGVADNTLQQYKWSFGDGTGFEADPSPVQHAYDRPGLMPVALTVTFRACPGKTVYDTIYVAAFPKVNLGPDSSICLHDQPIILRDVQEQPAGSRYLWSTGETGYSIRVKHHGIYSLSVTSPEDCTTEEVIEVRKDCYIDIPNVFTPNGDGINDYFFPRQLLAANVSAFSMQIFNRWGQKIFETDKTDGKGWDGRFNSADQPEGVFIYRIDVVLEGATKENYTGNLTLLR